MSLSRTPHGVRGLKLISSALSGCREMSHPAWGAWIEIIPTNATEVFVKSHPAWGAWIEIASGLPCDIEPSSHPAWGAWIEILS